MEYLDSSADEWEKMWENLKAHPLNNGDHRCENQGQFWEYMGSSEDHHHFRHHNHPASGNTEYIYLERIVSPIAWV